jgi:hypothetical protein
MLAPQSPAVMAVMLVVSGPTCFAADGSEGFRTLFDGRSLDGWETPDRSYWSVEDGAITGRITREHPCTVNQYLVWTGGELADFELKLKSRLNGEGAINNGFQFRSRVLPDRDVCGYQMDNNLQTSWLVRLYDEYGRHTLALRGERATFDINGRRDAAKIDGAGGAAWFRLEEWHEYHLVCVGSKVTLRVDGRLAAEVEDQDERRQELQGVFALQLHSGPPTVVQFKDIALKILKPAMQPVPATPSAVESRRMKLLGDALAWWPLDVGGHGAKPPLRHVPGWDRFELNVKAAGPGARPDAKVVVLEGAYFDAGPGLHAPADQLTVFLRVRDPKGAWNSALFAKRGGADRVHFNLFSADLPGSPGPDIGFEVCTAQGFSRVSFAVSRIEPTAWHDLAARYDGQALALFCDGRLLASQPCRGALVRNEEPLLIGAEADDGKTVRHFLGELEEAALWPRALSDEDIRLLSRLP